jgi:predicted nucleotidyltransferase
LSSPIAALKAILADIVGDDVRAVIVFGSVGRGEAQAGSDIDLAVIAKVGWDERSRIEDSIRRRLGNDCDVLVFTLAEFSRLAAEGEPVVAAVLADGVPLIGAMPRVRVGVL